MSSPQCLNEQRRAVLLYVYACCHDLALAEDIVQEAMVIAHRKQDQYFPEADFTCWLCSIARNVWLRERQRLVREEARRRVFEEQFPLMIEASSYSEARFETERTALAGCLEKLSDIDRQVIRIHFAERLKYPDIARTLNRTLAWVKVRMFRARALLSECLRHTLQTDET